MSKYRPYDSVIGLYCLPISAIPFSAALTVPWADKSLKPDVPRVDIKMLAPRQAVGPRIYPQIHGLSERLPLGPVQPGPAPAPLRPHRAGPHLQPGGRQDEPRPVRARHLLPPPPGRGAQRAPQGRTARLDCGAPPGMLHIHLLHLLRIRPLQLLLLLLLLLLFISSFYTSRYSCSPLATPAPHAPPDFSAPPTLLLLLLLLLISSFCTS